MRTAFFALFIACLALIFVNGTLNNDTGLPDKAEESFEFQEPEKPKARGINYSELTSAERRQAVERFLRQRDRIYKQMGYKIPSGTSTVGSMGTLSMAVCLLPNISLHLHRR